jgi:hypothetical protein
MTRHSAAATHQRPSLLALFTRGRPAGPGMVGTAGAPVIVGGAAMDGLTTMRTGMTDCGMLGECEPRSMPGGGAEGARGGREVRRTGSTSVDAAFSCGTGMFPTMEYSIHSGMSCVCGLILDEMTSSQSSAASMPAASEYRSAASRAVARRMTSGICGMSANPSRES